MNIKKMIKVVEYADILEIRYFRNTKDTIEYNTKILTNRMIHDMTYIGMFGTLIERVFFINIYNFAKAE